MLAHYSFLVNLNSIMWKKYCLTLVGGSEILKLLSVTKKNAVF